MPRDRNFTILPGPDRMVRLPPEVIAPITGYGQQIAPQTFVVTPEEAPGVMDPPGDIFENVTIVFPLDLVTGAAFVENDDNWGVGPQGYDAQRFWIRGNRGQGVRLGIADSGLDADHPAFVDLRSSGRLVAFAQFNKQGQKQVQRRPDNSVIPDLEAVPTFSHWHG